MRHVVVVALLVGCYAPQPQAGAPCPDGQCPAGLVCSPATKTCELISSDAAVDTTGITFDAELIDAAPPPTFLYRRRITIANGSATTLPAGFTIRLSLTGVLSTLVSQGKVRSDLADLRILGDGAIGERDRIVDPATGPAPAAVSFSLTQPIAAGATNTSYALYYGAPNAMPAPANGGAVFPLYDGFGSGIASFWLKNDAPTASMGRLVLRGGHTDALTTPMADPVPIVSAVEMLVSAVDPQSNSTVQPEGTFWYWFGYQHTGDFNASDPWIVWIARAQGVVHAEQKSPVGCETECDGPSVTQDTAFHYYAIERDPTATRFYRDGVMSYAMGVTNSGDYSIMVRNYMATSDLRVDYVRARARVSPDPGVALGSEENL